MAKKISYNEIRSLNEDWSLDERNGLPYSGLSVQNFVRQQLQKVVAETGGKIGAVEFNGNQLVFRDEEGGNIISTVSLGGAVYNIRVDSDTPSSFYVLASADSKVITLLPSTTEGSIGSSDSHDFPENYTWVLSVDSGSGFIDRKSGECFDDQSFSVDIRPYITTGANKIRIYVTGVESGQTRSVLFNCNMTSLYLTVNHTWQNAWIEGGKYVINGINFGGSVAKTLHVMIDNDESMHYTQDFAASVRYTTTAYQYDMTDKFPLTTGIHTVKVWMVGEGMETESYSYDIMCVKAGEQSSTRLVCVNQVSSELVNYLSQDVFKYATYGTNEVIVNIVASDGSETYPVVTEMGQTVQAGVKNTFSTSVEVPTSEQTGVSVSVSVRVEGGNTSVKEIEVSNKNSFPAVTGAAFYMNSALRSNSESHEERSKFINSAEGAAVVEYPATFEGFSFAADAWTVDDQNIKCLSVQAGSKVSASIRPLSALGSGSMTIEWKMKTSHIADYDSPIFSFMDTEAYDPDTTRGVIVFPTKVMCLTNVERNHVAQSVNLVEDEYLHIVIAFIRDYNGIGRNLCRIFVNGIPQCNFEYNGDFGNGAMRIGQESADIYLYMLRYYNGTGFEHQNVLKNYLNTLYSVEDKTRQGVSADNNIIDGNAVSYELVKRAGFNTMVIETGTSFIPDLEHTSSISDTSMMVEYADHPDWNFRISHAPLDGQGTTSMKYYRWNLRWKCGNDTVWEYPNASKTASTKKSGWFDGESAHPKVSKITAKKNVASSGQGHKMGATALYNDLYQHLSVGIQSDVPSGARVAVYEYPVVGFLKVGDEYTFIGLYTIGPDKGDSGTFGYDKAKFPSFLSLEGPNHAPLGTRFLHPWVDVDYNDAEETLEFGNEEGWDVDDCPYDTKKDKLPILQLATEEWKPAYELVYFCSPYLRSLAEIGKTIGELNADADNWRNGMDILGNRRNEVLTLYDANYKLVYYNKRRGEYVTMEGHDVRDYVSDYLDNTENPSSLEIIQARGDKFYYEAERFYNIGSACFHYCFCFLTGASDNDAKNTYPFKMKPLVEGGKWEWRQDDLDTILPTDNNGNSTKEYWIEPGDLALGVDVFQGSSSVFWTLIRTVFEKECKDMMMTRIFAAMQAIADTYNIKGDYIWQTIFNVFDHYFWHNSANYFPASLYDEDAFFAYLSVWMKDPNAAYNGVKPLTQALGTQYEAERQWVLRRIIYTMSKFEIGGFNGSSADGLGSLEFTPAETFTFNVSPAIELYPAGNRGGGTNIKGERTKVGEECGITATSDGSTTFYIKALDWLNSLGDVSGLKLTSRGGSDTAINFTLSSKRIRSLKVGDEDASKVKFNANELNVSGESFEEIDARNVTTLNKPVNLKNLPRLKRAYFAGSGATGISLPVGAKLEDVSMPSRVQEIFLHSLPLLRQENLDIPEEALRNISNLYYYECANLRPVDVLRSIINTEGNKLKFVTIIATTPQEAQADDISILAKLAVPYDAETDTGYGCLVYNNETGLVQSYTDRLPDIQGTYKVPVAYQQDIDMLGTKFPQLHIIAQKTAIHFADPEVERVLVESTSPKIDLDGDGFITKEEAVAATSLPSFQNNTKIESFEELGMFKNVKVIAVNCFSGCNNLVKIQLPQSIETIGSGAFSGIQAEFIINLPNLKSIPRAATGYDFGAFYGTNVTRIENLGDITAIDNGNYPRNNYYGLFQNCKKLCFVKLSSIITYLRHGTFADCTALDTVVCEAITPPSLTSEYLWSKMWRVFDNCPLSDGIYVPDASVEDYKAADGWSAYADKIKPLSQWDGE